MPNLSQHRQNPFLLALGKAIRQTRLAQGVSQEKLALIAGVDRSYVGRVERGDNNVAVLTLLKLTKALNITMAELATTAQL